MIINGKNRFIKLDIKGYEFADPTYEENSKWLNVELIAYDGIRKWKATDAILTIDELSKLKKWFEELSSSSSYGDAQLAFWEHEIAFDVKNGDLLIKLDFNFHPKANDYEFGVDEEYIVHFSKDELNLKEIIESIRRDLMKLNNSTQQKSPLHILGSRWVLSTAFIQQFLHDGILADQVDENADEVHDDDEESSHSISSFANDISKLKEGTYVWNSETESWECTSCKEENDEQELSIRYDENGSPYFVLYEDENHCYKKIKQNSKKKKRTDIFRAGNLLTESRLEFNNFTNKDIKRGGKTVKTRNGYFIICGLLLLLSSFMVLNCIELTGWNSGYAKGLNTRNESLEKMIFISDSIGFLFGSNWTDQAILNNKLGTQQRAIIYKTIDGGSTWNISLQAGRGIFIDAVNQFEIIYALKREYFGEQADQIKSAEVYRSVNYGTSWEKVGDAPTSSKQLFFCDSLNGFIITTIKNKVGRMLYQTNNAGQNWSPIKEFKAMGKLACSEDDSVLIFLSSSRSDKMSFDLLIQMEFQSTLQMSQSIPFEAYDLAIDQADNLWILGKEGSQVVLYSKSKSDGFEKVSSFSSDKSLQPYYVNVFQNSINVIVRESNIKDNDNNIFPIGLKYKIYVSNDLGLTWTEENIPVDYLIEPFAFYGEEKVWMNAGGGRLQWRN